MFRNASIQARSLVEICRLSETLNKLLTFETRSYHRAGIFDDNDDIPSKSYGKFKPRYLNRNVNYNSNPDSFKENRQFRDRNTFEKRNWNSFPNQFKHNSNRKFEQDLDSVKFETDKLPPIEKYLYAEHPNVSERSEDEVKDYRESLSISLTGSSVPKPITDFNELCLPDNLKRIVLQKDYSNPTPIQSQGWPIALGGRDMVGISQTGSGKTLVFMLPAIIHAMNQPHLKTKMGECKPQILVMAPTRELVQQILHVSSDFCDSCELISACAYGGASRNMQLRCLKGAHICIATPGRLIDFISEGLVSLEKCTYLVLDEADRMLDMGFEPQIRNVVGQIRPDRQTLMWSATWPREIQSLAEEFLRDYIKVTVGEGQLVANPKIEQNIYIVEEQDKEERLVSLLEEIASNNSNKVLIFAQTKKMVDYIGRNLNDMRMRSLVIHGDVSQSRRDQVLNSFRKQKSCILIATDVAARGLDITDIHHVINYDFPLNIEDYIHRIGRTARGFSTGVAHSFFTSENAGIADELITVLKQANQKINADLYSLIEKRHRYHGKPTKSFSRPRHQYAY